MEKEKDENLYRNMYVRVRDDCGERRGAVELLDFPVIQESEKQEYTAFLDLLEEKFKGREIMALQVYGQKNVGGASSPIGEYLCEMRSAKFKQASAVEDFINPLEEPVKTIPYKYQAKHAFIFKDGKDLGIVRISENKFEPPIAVRETLYDVTNLSAEQKKVFSESISKDYLDLETFHKAQDMLYKNGCALGEEISKAYLNRVNKPLSAEDAKDNVLPIEFRSGHSREGLDAILVSTSKSSVEDFDLGKSQFMEACKGPVTVYMETEYWHKVEENTPEGVRKYAVNLGTDASVTQYNNISMSSRVSGSGNKEITYGVKAGDLAIRSLDEVQGKKELNGATVSIERVCVMRVLPKGKDSSVKELKSVIEFNTVSKKMQAFRTLDGITDFVQWKEQAAIAKQYLELQEQSATFVRRKVNELFPLVKERESAYLFRQFARAKKTTLDKKLDSFLSIGKLREVNIGDVFKEKTVRQHMTNNKETGRE